MRKPTRYRTLKVKSRRTKVRFSRTIQPIWNRIFETSRDKLGLSEREARIWADDAARLLMLP